MPYSEWNAVIKKMLVNKLLKPPKGWSSILTKANLQILTNVPKSVKVLTWVEII